MGDATYEEESDLKTQGIIQVNGVTKVGIFNDAFEDIDFDIEETKEGQTPKNIHGTSHNGHVKHMANGHLKSKDRAKEGVSPQLNGVSKDTETPSHTIPNGHATELGIRPDSEMGEHHFTELFDLDISSESGQALFDLETGQLTGLNNIGPSLSAHQLALLASPLRRIKSPSRLGVIRTRNGFSARDFISLPANRKLPHNAQRRKPDCFLSVTLIIVLLVIVTAVIVVPILWVSESSGATSSPSANTTTADAAT